jgi:hypothetical protein
MEGRFEQSMYATLYSRCKLDQKLRLTEFLGLRKISLKNRDNDT